MLSYPIHFFLEILPHTLFIDNKRTSPTNKVENESSRVEIQPNSYSSQLDLIKIRSARNSTQVQAYLQLGSTG